MRSIHGWLASEETGKAFTHCLCCQFPLVEIDEPWLVNKDFVGEECVQGYAICQPCRERVMEPMDETSKQTVRDFLEHEIDWQARVKEFMLAHDATERFHHCVSCRQSRGELAGYGISALFDSGGILVEGALPLMMCLTCAGKMMASLTPQGRAIWQRFRATYFDDLPPAAGGFF